MPREVPKRAGGGISLLEGEIHPVYLLYGEEDLLVEEALQSILERALAGGDRGFNLDVLQGGDADARDIVDCASSFPMMAERRVVVVRDVEKMGGHDAEILAAYIDHPSATTCLLLTGIKPDLRRKPFSTLRKSGAAFEFRRLYDNQLPSWISARAAHSGRQLNGEGTRLLAASIGSSLRDIANELEKLFVYAGERKDLTEDDVAAVVGLSKEFSVFELQRMIGRRQTAQAVTILERMLEAGERTPIIIASLTSYFATLWKLHDLRRRGTSTKDQASLAHVNPYFFRDYAEALEATSPADIERAFLLLGEADESMKSSSSSDSRQIMQVLVLRLCGADGPDRDLTARNRGADAGV
jgi:DNA polymerase-3 subunit delta